MTPSPTSNGEKPRVCLAAPRASAWTTWGAARGVLQWPTHGLVEVAPLEGQTSLLNHCFNGCWAAALTGRESWGFTHFAMLHADVAPEFAWLDALYREMCAHGLDVISAVVPIKTPDGLTSTAVCNGDPWRVRRLTMTEVFSLPETFTTDDVCPEFGCGPLLVNTGCWLARLDRPWCDDLGEDGELRMCFRTKERIIPLPDGRYAHQVQPEDWLFSRYLHSRGARYGATRVVKLTHKGDAEFSNSYVWGTQETDEKFHDPAAREVSALREVSHENPFSSELQGEGV